jgi:hypothetical protein
MTRIAGFAVGVVLLFTTMSSAQAGLNAGATARLYWLSSTTSASTSRVSTSHDMVMCLVTIKGVTSVRSADLQLSINGFSPSGAAAPDGVPPAWQGQAGGPADGAFSCQAGSWGSTGSVWRNLFTVSPRVPGLLTLTPVYRYSGGIGADACVAPNGTAVIWFQAAGASGVARDPNVEYGLFVWTYELDGGLAGDSDDPNPSGVCIKPNYRLPCPAQERGNVMAIWDSTRTVDYIPFASGYQWLTWENSPQYPGSPASCLNLTTPVAQPTWGRLRRLYR